MIIRQAEEDDAQQIMALFHIILKEMEVPLLKQADDKNFAKRWSVLSKLLSVAKRLRKLSSQTLAEKWRESHLAIK